MSEDNIDDIDISNLLRSYDDRSSLTLRQKYELKLEELDINQTQALEIIGIEIRALNALLDASATRIDPSSLQKLSRFLCISDEEASKLYFKSLTPIVEQLQEIDKKIFITQNFDLVQLKSEGIIDTITDFDAIESRLVSLFDYKSIFDYRKDVISPAFSSAKLHKDNKMTDLWVEYARGIFQRINNIYPYDRKALIDFFPVIRWHSMNVEKGLVEVVRALNKMGITIIYLPRFKSMHLRGATFAVNQKPCIVLTDYRGNYPTLWFTLLHELHHVLFDWEEISVNSFHLSGDTNLYTESEIELEANQFARDYLFSDDKMKQIIPHIEDRYFIEEFSRKNHVHWSIPYIFYAFDMKSEAVWRKTRAIVPKPDLCLKHWPQKPFIKSVKVNAKYNNSKILN